MKIRYSDSRMHGFLSSWRYRTTRISCELLDGDLSSDHAFTVTEKRHVGKMVRQMQADGLTIRFVGDGIEVGTKMPLPPPDPFLERFVAQWKLETLPARILSLDHVEDRQGIPILKGVVFGTTGGDRVAAEPARYGLQETYVVGRLDVAPDQVSLRRHMRPTLRRARNTADQLAAVLPEWERKVARATPPVPEPVEEPVEIPDEDAEAIASAF